MALGYILARKSCSWTTIHDPVFVFTSPNMDQGISRGTRSHVVPEEVDIALWLEDSTTDKMYRIMPDLTTLEYCDNGTYGHFITIDYDDYKIDAYTTVGDVSSDTNVIYVNKFPTFRCPDTYMLDIFDNDLSKWTVVETSNCTISIDVNKLKFYMLSVSSDEYSYCRSTLSISGDFVLEATLSIDLVNVTDANSGAKINLMFDGSSEECYVKIRKDDIYIYSSFFGTSTFTKFVDSDISLKIARNDDKIYVYIAQTNYGYREYTVLENAPIVDVTPELGINIINSTAPVSVWYDYCIFTDYLSIVLPKQSLYDNRFYVDSYTPEFSHRYYLNETNTTYNDTIGHITLSGTDVTSVFNSDISDNTVYFDGTGIIVSDIYIDLGSSYSLSIFVTSDGHVCSGTSDFFGECQSIVNIVDDNDNFMSVGLTDTNTVYYKVRTSNGTFGSDTGKTLSSGTLNHIGIAVDSNSGIDFYFEGQLVSSLNESVGTISSGILSLGNVNKGVGSQFYGSVSDLVMVSGSVLNSNDIHKLYLNQPLSQLTPAIYGTSIGDISVNNGENVFFGFPNYKSDLFPSTSLHLIVKFGEAYNCYLTAWDDTTHTTTSNVVFSQQLLKLSAAVYRSTTSDNGYPGCGIQDKNNAYITSTVVSDMPICGNDYVFGKFNIVYYTGLNGDIGDVVVFRPRLSNVTKDDFPPGNYDFVITFHYQYT